jgi:hypothetical protein
LLEPAGYDITNGRTSVKYSRRGFKSCKLIAASRVTGLTGAMINWLW